MQQLKANNTMFVSAEVICYMHDGRGSMPRHVLQCLDTVVRTAPLRTMLYTGRGFMTMQSNDGSITDGDGIDVLPCSTSKFKITDSGLALYVDVNLSRFYSQISLLDLAVQVLNLNDAEKQNLPSRRLNDIERLKLKNEFRSIKVCRFGVPISATNPTVMVRSIASKATYEDDYKDKISGTNRTVAERYDEIGQRVMYPHLPCVELGLERMDL